MGKGWGEEELAEKDNGFCSKMAGEDMTDLVRNQPEPAAPCPHTETFRGEDSPRRWGSDRTQVCAACGMYRRTNHYNRDLSGWLPAEQYAAAVAPMEDE